MLYHSIQVWEVSNLIATICRMIRGAFCYRRYFNRSIFKTERILCCFKSSLLRTTFSLNAHLSWLIKYWWKHKWEWSISEIIRLYYVFLTISSSQLAINSIWNSLVLKETKRLTNQTMKFALVSHLKEKLIKKTINKWKTPKNPRVISQLREKLQGSQKL
jgi:hypothetical protein